MDFAIKNKVALVFASSDGLGKSTARQLVREGARVCICSRNIEKLKQTQEEIGAELFGSVDAEHFKAQPPRGKRGARYTYIETGALAENVHLQATVLGLGLVLVGGFDDDMVKAAMRLPPEFGPTGLLCVGKE